MERTLCNSVLLNTQKEERQPVWLQCKEKSCLAEVLLEILDPQRLQGSRLRGKVLKLNLTRPPVERRKDPLITQLFT